MLSLADVELAWVLDDEGAWHPLSAGENVSGEALPNSHLALQDIARGRTRRGGRSRDT